jgi:hypothetical protein
VDKHQALALILELEWRVAVLMDQLESLRQVSRLTPGSPADEARLAQIEQLKADLSLVLVELQDTYCLNREGGLRRGMLEE